ncbi:MAG: hypothetical protein AAGI06_03160, partial [Pseudomonadota bacterium]
MAKDQVTDNAPKAQGRVLKWILMSGTALTFVGLMVAGTAALHMRANAEVPPQANPPVSVNTKPIVLADSYAITERFAGRLEPARQTHLSFERA